MKIRFREIKRESDERIKTSIITVVFILISFILKQKAPISTFRNRRFFYVIFSLYSNKKGGISSTLFAPNLP